MYIDPESPIKDILDAIKSKVSWAEKNPGFILQPFSALLVRLSLDAEKTAISVNEKTQTLIDLTRALITLTRILIVMTAILIFLTIPLVYIEVSKFISERTQSAVHLPQQRKEGNQSNQGHTQQQSPNDEKNIPSMNSPTIIGPTNASPPDKKD